MLSETLFARSTSRVWGDLREAPRACREHGVEGGRTFRHTLAVISLSTVMTAVTAACAAPTDAPDESTGDTESNIEQTWTYYQLPLSHHKHLKSINMLERFNQEIKRRTLVVRIFPDEASCLRLVRAVAAEKHEEWMEGSRYLNMIELREQLKKPMALVAAAAA